MHIQPPLRWCSTRGTSHPDGLPPISTTLYSKNTPCCCSKNLHNIPKPHAQRDRVTLRRALRFRYRHFHVSRRECQVLQCSSLAGWLAGTTEADVRLFTQGTFFLFVVSFDGAPHTSETNLLTLLACRPLLLADSTDDASFLPKNCGPKRSEEITFPFCLGLRLDAF